MAFHGLATCFQIEERLAPYRASKPSGTFKDWVSAAYFDRVNLSANGFYKVLDAFVNFSLLPF